MDCHPLASAGSIRIVSGIQIWNQGAFQPFNTILELELSFLQASELNLIHIAFAGKSDNDVVQVSVLIFQLMQLTQDLISFGRIIHAFKTKLNWQ